jgi:hypothetical protein
MENWIITEKTARHLGRVWVPVSNELDSKTTDGSPNFEVGVEWAIVIGTEVVRGKFTTAVNPSVFGSTFGHAKQAVADLFAQIPLVGNAGPSVTVKDSPSGERKVTAVIPAAAAAAPSVGTTAAAAAPAVTHPPADAAPRRRGRPAAPAAPAPPPEPEPQEEPGDEPGDEPGNSEPTGPSGRTYAQLSQVVCVYGKPGGKMHGKTLADLDDAQREFIISSPDYEKWLATKPELVQLRKDTQEFVELKNLLGM